MYNDEIKRVIAKIKLRLAQGARRFLITGPPGSGRIIAARAIGEHIGGPFRAPHHTCSVLALAGKTRHVGGGTAYQFGEIYMARGGVLLLDDYPEFMRSSQDIAQCYGGDPIYTACGPVPADPVVIATASPCPCGQLGDLSPKRCDCSAAMVERYLARVWRARDGATYNWSEHKLALVPQSRGGLYAQA